MLGFTDGDDNTQWLYSTVQMARGEVKPGISKRLAAAISDNGAIAESPIAVDPADTLRWEITAYNDGHGALSDYTLTDTMQATYHFEGNLSLKIYDKDGKVSVSEPLSYLAMKIVQEDDGNFALKYCYGTVPLSEKTADVRNGWGSTADGLFQMWLTKDDSDNLSLHMRIKYVDAYIPPHGKAVLTIDTKKDNDAALANTVYVNTCYLTPGEEQMKEWDGTTNRGNVTAYDPEGKDENRLSVRNSAPVTTAYGFATSSRKEIAQTGDLTNSTTGNEGTNYIIMPDLTDKALTYTLGIDVPDGVPMSSLVLIDTLPYPGDHSSFQPDDPRFSEFNVSFANDPNVTVKVTDKNGAEKILTLSQYTVSYSNRTEFTQEDWRGTTTWENNPVGMRTLRVAITDENAIPADSHVIVTFNAVAGSDANYGQTAWNSFGYHYKAGSTELEAAPLKVGVKMPSRPYLQKSLVDHEGNSTTAKQAETFRFLLYSGKSLKTTDEAVIAESSRKASIIEVTVPQGESTSGRQMLDGLKVWQYTGGNWTQTTEDWTWTQNDYYTIVELPGSEDGEYKFQSINRRPDETGYQFVYQNDQTQIISAANLHDVWSLTIRKVDAANAETTIAGEWFALYSPNRDKALNYEALTEKPTNKPVETIEQDGQTWYLAQVSQTKNVEDSHGSLTWKNLRGETYLYQEIQAPKGYLLDPTIRIVTKNNDYSRVVTVTNQGAGCELPKIGGPGRLPFFLAGTLLIGGSAFVLCRKRKRKEAA